jgi:hypothetical protein
MMLKKNKIEPPKPVLSVDGCNLEIKTADIVEMRGHWEDKNIVVDYIRDFSLYKKMADLIKHYFAADVVMRWE